jgi:hypothetical protein
MNRNREVWAANPLARVVLSVATSSNGGTAPSSWTTCGRVKAKSSFGSSNRKASGDAIQWRPGPVGARDAEVTMAIRGDQTT